MSACVKSASSVALRVLHGVFSMTRMFKIHEAFLLPPQLQVDELQRLKGQSPSTTQAVIHSHKAYSLHTQSHGLGVPETKPSSLRTRPEHTTTPAHTPPPVFLPVLAPQ